MRRRSTTWSGAEGAGGAEEKRGGLSSGPPRFGFTGRRALPALGALLADAKLLRAQAARSLALHIAPAGIHFLSGIDFLLVRLLLTIGAGRAAGSAACFAALAPDLGHVVAVAAHHLATLAARLARLLGGELVRGALLMGGAAALTGDIALLLIIHGGEAAVAPSLSVVGHALTPACGLTPSRRLSATNVEARSLPASVLGNRTVGSNSELQ